MPYIKMKSRLFVQENNIHLFEFPRFDPKLLAPFISTHVHGADRLTPEKQRRHITQMHHPAALHNPLLLYVFMSCFLLHASLPTVLYILQPSADGAEIGYESLGYEGMIKGTINTYSTSGMSNFFECGTG